MSKISEKFHKWRDEYYSDSGMCILFDDFIDQACALADKIDGMIELPKDKDGEFIHMGDAVQYCNNEYMHVNALYFTGEWSICTTNGMFKPHDLSKRKPDSLERIADEIESACIVGDCDFVTVENKKLREFADRIRKLAEKEASDEL